jgi:hypothetical protein
VSDQDGRDFFVSYTGVNEPWARWICVQLEAREGKEHLVVDKDQASVCRLGAALERQRHLLDLEPADQQ